MLNVSRCFTLVSSHTGRVFILLWSCAGSPSDPASNGFLLSMLATVWLFLLLFHWTPGTAQQLLEREVMPAQTSVMLHAFLDYKVI